MARVILWTNSKSKKEQCGTCSNFCRNSAVGAFQPYMAESKVRVRRIDQEIEAEKKRDGKSKESLIELNQLEAKKIKKKKSFEN